MGIKVAKFGGTSLADASAFQRVRDIVLSDPARRYVVPSAPGKRFPEDVKITDLLYQCYKLAQRKESYTSVFDRIAERFSAIVRDLGLTFDLSPMLAETSQLIATASPDYAASRGEYFSGLILSKYLGWDFIDPAEVLKFDRQGHFAGEWSNQLLAERLEKHTNAVIPGFYGSLPNGEIKTFSRGGSGHLRRGGGPRGLCGPLRKLDRRVGLSDGRPAHRR